MTEQASSGVPGLRGSSDSSSNNGLEAQLGNYLPAIGRMSEQLKQTSAQIEQSVVDVCNSFQGIAERARATVAKATGFLGQRSDGTSVPRSFDELIENTGETLVRIMHATAESGEISRRAVESIERMDRASEQISAALGLLEELAKQNKMLALNARIEAAHAGSRGTGFEAVAIEVASQTQKSREVTSKVGALVENLRELANETLTDLRRINQQDLERVEASQREAKESLRDLRTAHEEMKAMLMGMTEDGTLLAKDIGSAVRGMQFQDRVSQRIAHVIAELDSMQSHLLASSGPIHADLAADETFRAYTMREEREAAGMHVAESPAGDVELF